MGLELPSTGEVYVDSQIVIYSVEKSRIYADLCRPFWRAVEEGRLQAVSSELTLMETLIVPLRNRDSSLVIDFESMWSRANTNLLPVSLPILRSAAELRATHPGLRTPDAIHIATAKLNRCSAILTNDAGFRLISDPPVLILDDYR